MSRRSSRLALASWTFGDGRDSTWVPLKWLAIWISEWAATIWISGLAHAASAPHAAGQIRPSSRTGADRRRQHPRDRRDRSVEAEFAKHREAAQRVRRYGADRGHQAERDRQIVVAALLRQVGGCEIDGDSPRRQREAGGDQCRADPLAGLGDRLVGQPDNGECGSSMTKFAWEFGSPLVDRS